VDNISEEDSGLKEERGAKCPYCEKMNNIYEYQTCEHYAGYFNVAECVWELEDGVMSKVQHVLEKEFKQIMVKEEKMTEAGAENDKELERLQEILDEGLGEYESIRLCEICPSALYEEDEEPVAVGPKNFAYSQLIFLDDKGLKDAKEFLANLV